MPRPPESRPSLWAFVGTTFGKLVALVALVGLTGVACGLAFGYPVGKIDLQVSTARQVDHAALQSSGSFDPSAALVQASDLPEGWTVSDQSLSAFSLFGPAGQFCGIDVDQSARLGDPLERSFVGPVRQVVMLSEVAQFRKIQDANTFIRELTKAMGACRSFVRSIGDRQTRVEIVDDLGDGPVVDYVARRLRSEGAVQVVIAFQLGTAVAAMQYIGPTSPNSGLLDKVQLSVLERVDPAQFSKTARVEGERPVPTEPTTTTTTTTLLPPTTTTTTIKRRAKPRTTTTPAPQTAPPPTAAPATPGQ